SFWRDHLQTVTMSLAQADITHGAKRLVMEGWSHQDMMDLAASVRIDENGQENKPAKVLGYDNPDNVITPEQALHALIYADQFKSALLIEALLSLEAEDMPDLQDLYAANAPEAGAPLQKIELGAATMQNWEMAQIMRKSADEQLPERVLSQITQADMMAGVDIDAEYIRLISSAQRATTARHAPVYLDKSQAYGHIRSPEWDVDKLLSNKKTPGNDFEFIPEQA
ncbi:MAG: hypothetical protein ACLFR0_07895, partial [Alphaproteobacteria bacterium]